ncbi:leucine rich repeat variant [Calothrix sp. NIES-4071]|nr:leucine rich repeat variant [Calothrix sp. NIES-4071]BAZ58070.1 leucine rich repeat variant [Calothrix sp. NIES-4105]
MQRLQLVSASDLQAFLGAPEQLLQQPTQLQLAVASFVETPRSLLEVLVNSASEEVAEAASLHVNWAGEITDWQRAVDEILESRQMGQNDRLAVELLKVGAVPPCFLSKWVPPERLIQGLRNPYMPLRYRLQLLERLAQEPTLEPRLQVAEAPETPLSVLEQLAGDLELPVRLAVKFNPSCPPQLIELVEGQRAVASNWNTDKEELAMLGQSRWAWVRLAVAQNPNASAETLMVLAQDAVYKIQLAVAKNPATRANVLAVLAEHPDKTIQETVAEHPNASEELLHQLFPTQKHILNRRKNLPASILERYFNEAPSEQPIWKNNELRYLFLRQPNTPTWILAELANVDIEALKVDILANQSSRPSPEVFNQWIQDNIRFLVDVAEHPQVSVEILYKLAQCPSLHVQLAVAQNVLAPEALKLRLLTNLATHSEEGIKVKIAKSLDTPVQILEVMAGRESRNIKLLLEIRRVLTSEYAVNANSFKSVADKLLSDLKHEILYPAGVSVDVERWINLIQTSGLFEVMIRNSTYDDTSIELEPLMNQLLPQWAELLPGLSNKQLEQILRNIPDLLAFINDEVKNNASSRSVAVALVGNPNTPELLREQLKNKLLRPSIPLTSHDSDCDLFLALAYNEQIPQAERMQYFQQLLSTGRNNIQETIARNPNTPPEIIGQLMARPGVGRQAVSRNPNAPASALSELAEDTNSATRSWVAENPSTPANILVQLARQPIEKTINNVSTVRETALKNPNFPPQERYRLQLLMEEENETASAHQLMARRPDSPYALSQVVEKGNQQAKLTAARSYKTPINILEQLAKDSDETVRQVVSQNSNLPLATLLELARDPSINVRLGLVYKNPHQKRSTPVQLLEILAQDPSEQVRAKVAEHPDTPVEILIRLANDTSREVKTKLTGNPNTPVTILTRLGLEENLVNVRNPNTPGSVLAQAIRTMSSKSIAEFIKHPVKGSQMPVETLTQLASHTDGSVRYRVACHPNTPATVLRQLARDSYVATVRAVASNANTSPETLEVLATHPDFTTCLDVVRNPNTPPRVLTQIVLSTRTSANLPNQTVDMLKSAFPGNHNDLLRDIASNPRTPLEALEIIARREFVSATPDPNSIIPPRTDDDIVRALAYNPNLTPELLAILTQDLCVDVRVCLIRHPNLTEALWLRLTQDAAVSVREAVASSVQVPANVLELLAQDEQALVRAKVAANPNTLITTLELLAGDSNSNVRTAVASNPNLRVTTLEQLANDEKVEVRRTVAQNSNTPASIRETLRDLILQPTTRQTSPTLRGLSRIYNPSTDDLPTILIEYAQSENAFVRFITLLHPLTPLNILNEGALSASWLERYAVADNPATSTQIKQQLTKDSNRIVRAAVMANL